MDSIWAWVAVLVVVFFLFLVPTGSKKKRQTSRPENLERRFSRQVQEEILKVDSFARLKALNNRVEKLDEQRIEKIDNASVENRYQVAQSALDALLSDRDKEFAWRYEPSSLSPLTPISHLKLSKKVFTALDKLNEAKVETDRFPPDAGKWTGYIASECFNALEDGWEIVDEDLIDDLIEFRKIVEDPKRSTKSKITGIDKFLKKVTSDDWEYAVDGLNLREDEIFGGAFFMEKYGNTEPAES